MAWGDVWGDTPRENAKKLAAAFLEGRAYGSKKKGTYVDFDRRHIHMEYVYKDRVLARYTPLNLVPEVVALELAGVWLGESYFPVMEFTINYGDKGEARHLQALGVDAKWQYGKRPFLAFGADITDCEWRTIEQAKALPKWQEALVSVRPRQFERFVNLTRPLFA